MSYFLSLLASGFSHFHLGCFHGVEEASGESVDNALLVSVVHAVQVQAIGVCVVAVGEPPAAAEPHCAIAFPV